jgi:Na+-transporting NADH:ubiquinone oxidoreductase subunit C
MKYIFLFSAAICLVCSMMISVSAVGLKSRQELNKKLDRQKSVLQAAWLLKPGQSASAKEILDMFKDIRPEVIDLSTGDVDKSADSESFDPATVKMSPAPPNPAQVKDIPQKIKIFEVLKDGKVSMLVLPIHGKGLWSDMLGYLALDADGNTIRGLTYYEQGETPGLGGEVDNPRWKALWPGRKIYGTDGKVDISVIKGKAGPPDQDPYKVDGLSGATITSRGVQSMLHFWMGNEGYEPFLKKFREGRSS